MNISKYRKLHTKCEQCISTSNLLVHHLDKNRKNNIEENLQVLCASCHAIVHKRIMNIRGMRRFYITLKDQMIFPFYEKEVTVFPVFNTDNQMTFPFYKAV